MLASNSALNILVENATTFKERNMIFSLTEAETKNLSNTLITNLYKSVINKAHIDFDDIPETKGDVTKYSGYRSMTESLGYLKQLASSSMTKINDIDIVDKALMNIVAYREQFEKGFALNKEFIMLQYCALVASCVEATSSLISSYVDFIRKVDKVEFKLINTKNNAGGICIKNLESFNKTVSSGEFSKIINSIIKSDNEAFTGAAILGGTIAVIAIMSAIIIGIREIIFYFYYTRMKLSDYLKLQAYFLDMNRNNVEANTNIPIKKKNEIIRDQEELSRKLRKFSDKLKVEQAMTQPKVNRELKKENSEWNINSIQNQNAKQDDNGFELL